MRTKNFMALAHFITAAPTAGILERLRTIDHRKLKLARRAIDGNASVFGEDQHEERDHQKDMRRLEKFAIGVIQRICTM
jgi:hypothetical protein